MRTPYKSSIARVIPLFLLLTLQVAGACSQKPESQDCPEDQSITVKGHLRFMGNEPFVRTAVVTDDDMRYLLHADRQIVDAMWNARSRLEITGHCLEDHEFELPGLYIEVHSWEPVTDP